MSRNTIFKTILILAAMLLLVVPVMAGGWAVVTVDSLPKDVHAGDNIHLEFMVRQHGDKPVHSVDFMQGEPLVPYLLARHSDTGQTIQVEAQPAEEVGRFTLDVVFPSEGSWQWQITPHPLEGTIQFEPLTVLASLPAGLAASQEPGQAAETRDVAPGMSLPAGRALLRWSALGLLLAAALTTLLAWHQRRQPLPPLAAHSD
jgi:hypothetical protein